MANSSGADYSRGKWSPGSGPGTQGGQGGGQGGGLGAGHSQGAGQGGGQGAGHSQGADSLTKWGMASAQSPTTPLFMQDQKPTNGKDINVVDL